MSCRGSLGHISYLSRYMLCKTVAGSGWRRAGTLLIPCRSSSNASAVSPGFEEMVSFWHEHLCSSQ